MKFCIVLTTFLLILISCDDSSTDHVQSGSNWLYMSRCQEFESCDYRRVSRINLQSGKTEDILDSAMIMPQVNGSKILYLKQMNTRSEGRNIKEQYLWISDPDGQNAEQVLDYNFGDDYLKPILSPNGEYAMITGESVFAINLNTRSMDSVMKYYKYSSDGAFSQDGNKFAFTIDSEGFAIYNFPISTFKTVFSQAYDRIRRGLCWVDNDSRVVFRLHEPKGTVIVGCDLSTGKIDTVLKGFNSYELCSYDNGSKIVFSDLTSLTTNNYIFRIYRCNSDGSDLEQISPEGGNGYSNLSFIVDNEVLAGKIIPNGNGKIDHFVGINLDTKKIRIITEQFPID